MKRWLFTLAAALGVVAVALGQTANPPLTPQEEAARVSEIVELNPQISNPDVVRPGDTIKVVIGEWRDRKPACLTDVARAADSLANAPERPAATQNAEMFGQTGLGAGSARDESKNPLYGWLLFALVVMGALWFVLSSVRRLREPWVPRWLREREDPDRYQPVRASGLGADTASAQRVLAETQVQQPPQLRRPISRIERGALRHDGQARLRVRMAFGDGQEREVTLVNGERVARVTFEDGGVGFYRWACANGMVSDEIGQDGSLPAGWEFVSEAEAAEAPATAPVAESAPRPPVPVLAVAASGPNGNGHRPHMHRLVVRSSKSRDGNTTTYTVESTEPIGGFDIPDGGGKVLTARPRQ